MSNTDTGAGVGGTNQTRIGDEGLVDSKHASKSVSFWGAIITAVPLLVQMTGLHVSTTEAVAAVQQVHAVADSVQSGWLSVVALIGFVQMIVGRYTASQPIHFLDPYQVDPATGKKVAPVKPLDLTGVGKVMDDHPLPATAKPASMGG